MGPVRNAPIKHSTKRRGFFIYNKVMSHYEKNYDDLKTNDMDNVIPAGRPASFDNLIYRFAPLLISLEPAETELIKMAYLTACQNNGQIDDTLLAEALKISPRTLRNRKNRIISKINAVLGLDRGKTFPHPENS